MNQQNKKKFSNPAGRVGHSSGWVTGLEGAV